MVGSPGAPSSRPQAVQEDGDGWRTVDSLTAWQCGLNPFRSLEVVPTSCREKLAKAVSIVIRRIQEAQSEEELNRGLKRFLLLPQLFLRERARVAMLCLLGWTVLVSRDWGSLLIRPDTDSQTGGKETSGGCSSGHWPEAS